MNKKRDDIINKLIKKVDLDSPSCDFTDSIMEQLTITFENEPNSDPIFTDLLKQSPKVYLPDNFTDTILETVNSPYSTLRILPIITKKTGLVFSLVMIVLIIVSFLLKKEAPITGNVNTYNLNFLYELVNNSSVMPILFMSIVSLSSLLLLDYNLKNTNILKIEKQRLQKL